MEKVAGRERLFAAKSRKEGFLRSLSTEQHTSEAFTDET
jgi:hypothetical protein